VIKYSKPEPEPKVAKKYKTKLSKPIQIRLSRNYTFQSESIKILKCSRI